MNAVPKYIVYTVLFLVSCGPATNPDASADLILTNGSIYTLRWDDPAPDGTLAANAPHQGAWQPDAQAVAVQNGHIIFVGSTEDALRFRGDDTRVVDLSGATVTPGAVDSHTHVFGLGAALEQVSLVGVETESEAIGLIVERAGNTPPGEWIFGQGWDEGAWANRYPDKKTLSQAVPNNPVYLRSLHGFAGWVNQEALDALGIDGSTDVPTGGEMRLGPDGQPTGLFLNRAVTLLDDGIPAPNQAALMRRAMTGLTQMAEDG